MRILALIIFLGACTNNHQISHLPQAITNNAVALVKSKKQSELYSFNGLYAGKTWKDISNSSYQYKNKQWQEINSALNSQPVLASTAVSIGQSIYLIGGYTVDEKHNEKSMPDIFKLNTLKNQWSSETKMPIPVDDTVALVYQDRYIYLVSGWHDDDNVSDVQVYDTLEKNWFTATEFPAPSVFGHAGGIVNDQMLICDGVKVNKINEKKDFVASSVCVLGVINGDNPKLINWQLIPHHSGTAYYRMAAVGDYNHNRVIFAGGSNNPYNFDGIGYNGQPSNASGLVFSFDFENQKWNQFELKLPENMDHRSLLYDGDWFYIIGGMENEQKVSNQVLQFKLTK